MDPGSPSSIAILAESDQAILIIFDRKFLRTINLLSIDIKSLKVTHLKDLIHICLEPEDQNRNTFKILSFNLNRPHFTS